MIAVILFVQLLTLSASSAGPSTPPPPVVPRLDTCAQLYNSCRNTYQANLKALKDKEARLRSDLGKEVTRQTLETGKTGKPASEADKAKIEKMKAEIATFPQQYDALDKQYADCYPGKSGCEKK